MQYKISILTFIFGLALGLLISTKLLPNSNQTNEEVKQVNAVPPQEVEIVEPEINVHTATCETFYQATDSSPQVEQLLQQVAQLESDNAELTEQVAAKTTELTRESMHRKSIERQLGELSESEISNEQMKELVPEPYGDFLVIFKGETRDRVYDFYKQPEDLEQGFDLQNRISDFIQTHSKGTGVRLDGVICKQNTCEIRVYEHDPSTNSWHIIWNDMNSQHWWNFHSTHSSSRGNDDDQPGVWLYIFVDTFEN